MAAFLGIARYEYAMAIRRWGVWLAFGLAAIPVLSSISAYGEGGAAAPLTGWALAGLAALVMNTLTPVVGGIAMADRLARDGRLGVSELLRSMPVPRRSFILGKYAGMVLATLTPVLLILLAGDVYLVAQGGPADTLWASLAAFVAINVPAYLFIGAFALACTAVLPVRVFQVLFIGYWFWGNFLSPKVMPTLAGTLLTPSGQFVHNAFFRVPGMQQAGNPHTPLEAVLNLAVLAGCAAIALVALERYGAWEERRG